ncbi:MAG TPA: prolyl oligopeptidase family serine peptidase [Thermoanaerobaculia bacterium]|nr:prolyl oligopeptidase family serine peptidase [Thermoanaerobaculia bacterium]
MLGALLLTATISQGHFVERVVTVDGVERRYQVWIPAGYDSSRQWPAILFLHGAGERGSDNRRQTEVGLGPALREGIVSVPAVIAFPQCPDEGYWAGPERHIAMAVLDAVEKEFSIDKRRVTLTGLSMGGTGTWILAAENPRRFAAIAPVCGWVSTPPPFRTVADPPDWLWNAPDRFDAVARRIGDTPTWILHGGLDTVVPPEESRQMIARLGVNAAYTEFPQANHNSWDPAYRTTGVVAWLARQRLSSRA